MKKIFYFLPAIIFTLFYGLIGLLGSFKVISPIVALWLILFMVAGYLLSKRRLWGFLFGIIPGIHLIYMSTQETGQILNIERPTGVIVLLFYLLCGYIVFKNKHENR